MTLSASRVKQKAIKSGFNLVGITPAEPSPMLDAYMAWIHDGMHGKMGYMARPDRIDRRQDLNIILPNVQSILVVGMDYRSNQFAEEQLEDPSRGRIASYAWNLDYHDVIGDRLDDFAKWIKQELSQTVDHKIYVDTGAILERSHAQQAGLGFLGKNTMLINPRRGSYFFLGEILLSEEFDQYDTPHRLQMCGSCTSCLNACPTDAFPEPNVLDARRCISYHTIENKGWIDRDLRASFGNWVFGCDICQDVCPFQRFTPNSSEPAFHPPNLDHAAPKLVELLMLDDLAFARKFNGTPVYRVRRRRLVRNACIAAGNWKDPSVIPYLIQLLYDPEPLVRGHASWALFQVMGDDATVMLTQQYDREDSAEVRHEIEALIG